MRIVFMGTPEPAASLLQTLIESQHEIVAVVTQPDRPKGRGKKIVASPVKELALKNNLPVEQPEKVKNNPEFVGKLKNLNPDVIVVVAYGKILPVEILGLPKHGCLNVHASLLPKYRGAAPIQWALLNGEKETGLTIMKLDQGLDTGDVILQEKVLIAENDNAKTLMEKIFAQAKPLLIKALGLIEKGQAKLVKQDDAQVTFAPLIKKEQGEINWHKAAKDIHDQIRALVLWPGAQTRFKNKLLKIWQARLSEGQANVITEKQNGDPGTIVQVKKNQGFVVAAGQGALLLTEVQLEGKKKTSAYNFFIGHDVKIGDKIPS